jgi:FAD/FMN-containing dehydrogenase
LQDVTGGAVEAFEFMPARYMREYEAKHPQAQAVFDREYAVNVLVELGATAPRDVTPGPDGSVPIATYLEEVLGDLLEQGAVLDAVVAQNDAQRSAMWARREAAAELSLSRRPLVVSDVAVALDQVAEFLEKAGARMAALAPDYDTMIVSHLGDGNIHYVVWPSEGVSLDAVTEAVEDVVQELGGSFSAEHGIGVSKLGSMRRRKDPVALDMMRAIKTALDPSGILNPGKLIPDLD